MTKTCFQCKSFHHVCRCLRDSYHTSRIERRPEHSKDQNFVRERNQILSGRATCAPSRVVFLVACCFFGGGRGHRWERNQLKKHEGSCSTDSWWVVIMAKSDCQCLKDLAGLKYCSDICGNLIFVSCWDSFMLMNISRHSQLK